MTFATAKLYRSPRRRRPSNGAAQFAASYERPSHSPTQTNLRRTTRSRSTKVLSGHSLCTKHSPRIKNDAPPAAPSSSWDQIPIYWSDCERRFAARTFGNAIKWHAFKAWSPSDLVRLRDVWGITSGIQNRSIAGLYRGLAFVRLA